jgi:hypothetical protein
MLNLTIDLQSLRILFPSHMLSHLAWKASYKAHLHTKFQALHLN